MDKTILITGAKGNLGSAVTKRLLDSGIRVIGTVSPGSKKPDTGADYYECDVTNEKEVGMLFDKLKASYDHLDGAIMLVGGFNMGHLNETSSSDMNKMFNLNFMSAFLIAQASMGWMGSRAGSLIFVGAKPAIGTGGSAVFPYAISKNAVIKMAEIIDEDESYPNIRSSVIIPGIIDTEPNRKSMPEANFEDWVTPGSIAEHIIFLISETARPLRGAQLKLYNNS